jgi:ferrochelatase
VRASIAELTERGFAADAIRVLFATHSIPVQDAERSGPDGDAYQRQHLAVAEAVMTAAGALGGGQDTGWELVYQSRSGPPTQAWLEPDVNEVIRELPARGVEAVVIVPLGFVSDHMEVLWDLDTEAMETAAEVGVVALRAPTPGVDPAYVSGLVDLILERVNGTPISERPHETDLGPWYDVCRPGCCENVRLGFRPAIAGLAP